MEFLMNTLSIPAVQTALVAILVFLYQAYTSHKLSEDLKSFEIEKKKTADVELKRLENELKLKTDSELELFRSELKIQNDFKLEAYKNELKRQNDHELEATRNKLLMAMHEHNVIFTKLHENRCLIIAQVYGSMVEYKRTVARYIMEYVPKGTEPVEKRGEAAIAAMEAFHKAYFPNEIYFERETAGEIRKFEMNLWGIMQDFKLFVEKGADQVEQINSWKGTAKSMTENVQPLFDRIHSEFQIMLGVQTSAAEKREGDN